MKTKQKQTQKTLPKFHENLVNAFNNSENSKFDLAVSMFECYTCLEENGLTSWQILGYQNFKEYVEKEFGLEYRNAMYYVKAGECIMYHNLTKEDFENVGWSKMKLIMPELIKSEMSTSDVNKMLKSIQKMTVDELRQLLSKNKNKKKKDDGIIKKTFSFTIEQAEVINTAINMIKDKKGIDSDSMALEILCSLYISSSDLFEQE